MIFLRYIGQGREARLTLSNVRFAAVRPEARPPIICDNVENLEIVGAELGATFSGEPVIRLRQVRDAVVRDCLSSGAAQSFVRVEDSRANDVTVAANNLHRASKEIEIIP